jgi:hypothetical protein
MSRLTCRAYERNKIEVAKNRSERMKADNPAQRPGVGDKIADTKRGVKREPFSQEWLDNLSAAHSGEGNGMFGKTHRVESKALQSAQAKKYGWVTDGVDNKRVLKTHINDWLSRGWSVGRTLRATGERQKIKCPHCGVEAAANTYKQWHGDNCRHKT